MGLGSIITDYKQVIIALAVTLGALLLAAGVISIVSRKTTESVENISYEEMIYDAIGATKPEGN